MARDRHNQFGTLWTFRSGRFLVGLTLEETPGYQYDGDDPDGETQAAIDSGEYVAFDSKVWVELDGEEIASDYLCGSVYADTQDFVSEHYGCRPKGYGAYFPDMVRQAIGEARDYLRTRQAPPYIRASA